MSFEKYRAQHIDSRLQVIQFTENGFLLDSCHSIIDLRVHQSTPLFQLFPFIKKYRHIYSDLQADALKHFQGIELEFDQKQYVFDVSFQKKEGQLICVMEDVSRHYKRASAPIEIKGGDPLLLAQLEEMKKIQKIRQDHFSKIAHDIKLPLTEIIGITYILKNRIEEQKVLEYIDALSHSARNLDTMLNDLMAFAKSESYKFRLESHSFAIGQTLQSVVTAFDFKTQEQNVPIIIHLHPDTPKQIKGDPTRLSQILYNLIDNALKFTKQGEINIYVKPQKSDCNSCTLKFQVLDTGIGIPQESLNSIFETYNQVDKKDAQNGFGIGLSIVKQLVELQGGHIQVESKLGEGTIFSFAILYDLPQDVNVV